MSYQVLARKWRPRSFREMVGQTHVLKALINALDNQRLHHAYLFTGTRGVGKTTIARILAKCLNCEQGVSSTPCGQCSVCREIDEGRFVDLIEVDAASRTKVEDTRELLDNVQYAPSRGRYKVYLIDEVHMLSTHSFNALLKTLEEPPPHVKFLLATTDPQKLPVTILSRCLQFSLKNMPPERVVEHLTHVLTAEQIPFEEDALWLLGRAADGSMRDAMSLTDQAIAFGEGKVLAADVRAMLGTLDHGQVYGVLQALLAGDARALLEAVRQLAEQGPDWAGVLAEMLNVLHRVAIAQVLPEAVDNGQGDRERVLALAGALPAEDVQFYYQMGLIGRRDLPLAPDPRSGFEMVLLRMLAFRPADAARAPDTPLKTAGISEATTDSATPPVAAAAGAAPVPSAAPVVDVPWDVTPSAQELRPEGEAPTPDASVGAAPSPRTAPHAQELRPEGVSPAPAVPVGAAPSPRTAPPVGAAPSPRTAPPVGAAPSPRTASHAQELRPEGGAPAPSAPVGAAPSPRMAPPAQELRPEGGAPTPDAPVGAAPSPRTAPHAQELRPEGGAPTPAVPVGAAPSPRMAAADAASEEADDDFDSVDVDAYAYLESMQPVDAFEPEKAAAAEEPLPAACPATGLAAEWLELFPKLGLAGMTASIAANCTLVAVDGDRWHLHLDPGQSALFNAGQQRRLTDALSSYHGRPLTLQIDIVRPEQETPAQAAARQRAERQRAAEASIHADPLVRQMMEQFAAVIRDGTIVPLDN